nr:hypothetical protein GCM10025730_07790 [Promicromonospora thailandica]
MTLASGLALGAAPASALPPGPAHTGPVHPGPAHPGPAHPGQHRTFDLQAHRGGVALTVENTLPAFDKALALGVSTLELDVQITRDGYAVVTHDRDPNPAKCVDTTPAYPGDPQFPYVPGTTYIKDLTLAQVRTIDCGSLRQPQFPGQELHPGERMPLLTEVLDLVNRHRARQVTLNIETKVEAGAPSRPRPASSSCRSSPARCAAPGSWTRSRSRASTGAR